MVQRPSLWRHARRWGRLANAGAAVHRLDSGSLVVLDAALATEVLASTGRYHDATPFLRTSTHGPLDRHVRARLTRDLLIALDAHDFAPAPLASLPDRPLRLRTFAWGAQQLRRLLAPVIACDRAPALDLLVDAFVREKIVGDGLSGRLRRMPDRRRDDLGARMSAALTDETPNSRPIDLVDVVAPLLDELPHGEIGELYLRLATSLLGFTGVALEWATLLAVEHDEFGSAARDGQPLRHHLLEAQRLYPTAWRLVRTAAIDHELAGERIGPGDAVIVATSALHRHRDHWEEAERFHARRWEHITAEQRRAYLPFGRGPGICPGREIALDIIERLVADLFGAHEVSVTGAKSKPPYVRAAMGPPRRRLVVGPLRPQEAVTSRRLRSPTSGGANG